MILPEWDFTRKEQVWIKNLSVAQKEELLRGLRCDYHVDYRDSLRVEDMTSLYHQGSGSFTVLGEDLSKFNSYKKSFTTLEINPKPTRVIDLSSVLG